PHMRCSKSQGERPSSKAWSNLVAISSGPPGEQDLILKGRVPRIETFERRKFHTQKDCTSVGAVCDRPLCRNPRQSQLSTSRVVTDRPYSALSRPCAGHDARPVGDGGVRWIHELKDNRETLIGAEDDA